MAIYLKKFETQAAYEAAESSLILPNVSLTVDNNTVHYNPLPPTPSHDYVEIGGVKWATMNVGANSVTDYGLFFQWGDTQGYTASQVGSGEGQKYFGWADYKYCSGAGTSSSAMTKYNSTDHKTVLEASDDAVRANWGINWRMPTKDEFVALGTACKFIDASGTEITGRDKRTTLSGVTGIYLEDKTDSSKKLFFPAAGYCNDGSVYSVGSYGSYWSSSLRSNTVSTAYRLYFDGSSVDWQFAYYRYRGYTVRGVLDE